MSRPSTLTPRETLISMCLIALLFFVFGFITWINAILIPYFKVACELDNFQSYLVAFAFYIAYLVMAVPAALLLKKLGFKRGMMLGFFAMAAGAFVFVVAAQYRAYGIFLTGLFLIGTGLAVLQTAANPYVTILGPRESAARRISIVGICNKGAGILAPLLLAAVILRPSDTELFRALPGLHGAARAQELDALIHRVRAPYAGACLVLIALGLLVRFSPLPEIDTEHESADVAAGNAGKTHVFQFPYLVLGAIAIFVHVGTQVIAVDTVIGYASSMGLSLTEAKIFPSYTLSATILGYFAGILCIPRLIGQTAALRLCTLLGLALSLLAVVTHGEVSWFGHRTDVSLCFVVLLGLANSLIWAGIWPLALHNLGRFTKTGASILIMGLCGNALLPLAYGFLADRYGLQRAYGVLIPCYLYLIFYALYGHSITSWTRKPPLAPAEMR